MAGPLTVGVAVHNRSFFSWLVLLVVAACGGTETRPAHTADVATSGEALLVVDEARSENVIAMKDPPPPNATFLSDRLPVRMEARDGFALHKACDAYKTHGAYDVAYTGQTGRWTFAVPAVKIKSARLVLSMDADDHATPIDRYKYTLWSATHGHNSPVPLFHGIPAMAPFDNWVEVSVPAEVVPGETFTVSLTNTSEGMSQQDWIAVRWIELQITTQ